MGYESKAAVKEKQLNYTQDNNIWARGSLTHHSVVISKTKLDYRKRRTIKWECLTLASMTAAMKLRKSSGCAEGTKVALRLYTSGLHTYRPNSDFLCDGHHFVSYLEGTHTHTHTHTQTVTHIIILTTISCI